MKKKLGIGGLLFLFFVIGLFVILNKPYKYDECIININQYNDIISKREENTCLLEGILFNDQDLLCDEIENTYYYSLIDEYKMAFNPKIIVKSNKKVKINFIEKSITEELIENNESIQFVVYSNTDYCTGEIKCTTLPIINIECDGNINDEEINMNFEVFDNRKTSQNRFIKSDGKIRTRGATSLKYPKKGYHVSLSKNSMESGGKIKKNKIPLLGMNENNEWILYAAYNDNEKVRNVFSSNLWKYTCATDNEFGIDMGVEFKYVELFINNEYSGLYALGYTLRKGQLNKNDKNVGTLYKKNTQYQDGFELKHPDEEMQLNDELNTIFDYYYMLYANKKNNGFLYNGIDLNNYIDWFLFVNMVQGIDNMDKNFYVYFIESNDILKGLYCPWDLDLTWGNLYSEDEKQNNTAVAACKPEKNAIKNFGYLHQIMVNNDSEIFNIIIKKYNDLRNQKWSNQSIFNLIDEYEDDIFGSGAFLRDKERWPEGTYTIPEKKLNDFRDHVGKRLDAMDKFFLEAKDNNDILIPDKRDFFSFINIKNINGIQSYIKALAMTDNVVLIDVNDKAIWSDEEYKKTLMKVGLPSFDNDVDMILWDFGKDDGVVLSNFHKVGGKVETKLGELELLLNQNGEYVLYLGNQEVYAGHMDEANQGGIKITTYSKDMMQKKDFVYWKFEKYEKQGSKLRINECVRN